MSESHIIPKYFKHVKTYSIPHRDQVLGILARPYKRRNDYLPSLGLLWETTLFLFKFQASVLLQPTEAEYN